MAHGNASDAISVLDHDLADRKVTADLASCESLILKPPADDVCNLLRGLFNIRKAPLVEHTERGGCRPAVSTPDE